MKRIVFLLLAIISIQAVAQNDESARTRFTNIPLYSPNWEKICETRTDDGVYVDTASVVRKGQGRSVWVLFNYRQASQVNSKLSRSLMSYRTYSCIDKTVVGKREVHYADYRGRGKIVEHLVVDAPKLKTVKPGTVEQLIFDSVCKTVPTSSQ